MITALSLSSELEMMALTALFLVSVRNQSERVLISMKLTCCVEDKALTTSPPHHSLL